MSAASNAGSLARWHRPNVGSTALILALLCLVAIAPLLRAESPCTHDGGLHYYRVTALRQALRDGLLFSRYLPDLAFGYGYPFFNYREPLPYYLTVALHVAGLPLPLALNLIYVLSILGSAFAAYLLARDLFGPTAGVVAAVVYAYAPYQFLDALLRGNSPESVALPLLPLILWAFRRLALSGSRTYFVLSAGSLAALLLTHNISSLLMMPVLLAYLAVLWLAYRRQGHWLAAGGALAIGLGVTAFMWAPALLEQDYVQLHLSRVTRNNDYHYNFLSLAEVLSPPRAFDTSLLNPPMQVHLGLPQAALGGIGLLVGFLRARDRERRATLAFLALLAGGMVWMSTPTSLWVWDHAPLLSFVQFPWRFVGRATLPLALLAAAGFAGPIATGRGWRPALGTTALGTAIAVTILCAYPYTYPPLGYCPSAPYPTVNDVFAYERGTRLVGVDPEGSYFPVGVDQRPEGSPLEAQYAAGEPVTRFDETALPEGASIAEAVYGANRASLVVDTPVAFRARYLVFYFPGWKVSVDGQEVGVAPSQPEGLLTFPMPAGRHRVTIRFGETPLRAGADTLSILSLAALAAVLVRRPRRQSVDSRDTASLTGVSGALPAPSALVALGLSLALLGAKLVVVDRSDTLFRRPFLQQGGTLVGLSHTLYQRFADGLTLIGYNLYDATIPADGGLRLDLLWTSYAPPGSSYQSVIHLVGPDGLRWSLQDTFRPRGYSDFPSSTTWRADRYAVDSHEIAPLPGTPPGTYDVVVTAFDRGTLAPLSVLNSLGQPAAPSLSLGTVKLTAPLRPLHPDSLGIRRLDVALGPLTLLGAELDRAEAAPGDVVLLTLFWRADRQPAVDLTISLALLAPDGATAVEYRLSPTAAWHPSSAWKAGEIWRGQHVLRLPAHLDSGDYACSLSLTPGGELIDLPSTLRIGAPPHSFAPPTFQHPVGNTLGGLGTLVGFDTTAQAVLPGDEITVTLVWRAEVTPDTSYHVFLHLIDPEGRLAAQSDGIPGGWSRPTTGWLPGEYIVDVRTLTVPGTAAAGRYALSVGLYVPGGERLAATDGSEAIPLFAVSVVPR